MELDLIDTLAARVVRAQARRVAIGGFRQRERFGAAERFAPAFELDLGLCRACARNGLLQRDVAPIEVASLVGRRLIRKGRRDHRRIPVPPVVSTKWQPTVSINSISVRSITGCSSGMSRDSTRQGVLSAAANQSLSAGMPLSS